MKYCGLLILTFLLLSVPCKGTLIPFSPISHNYLPQTYNAGGQNWSVTQDKNGVMYFGNNKGLLEFDGNRWRLYPIPSGEVVRSVHAGKDGRLYIGSFEEFGYFERNLAGTLEYHSLKQNVRNFKFHNDEIWTIIESKKKVIFQSFGSYFVYDGQKTIGYRTKGLPLNMFKVGETVYSQFIDGGLNVFMGNSFRPIIERNLLGNDDVIAGFPHPDGTLFITRNNGGFIYSNSKITPWKSECTEAFNRWSINRAIMTKDSCYIIGTLSDGIYAVNKNGKLLWKENAESQLENNTVLGLFCDSNNNLWAALDYGIAYIQYNSQIYHYEPTSQKMGMVYDVLVSDHEAYIASNQGLYRFSEGKLAIIPGLEEQAWTVGEWGKQIICGHNKGTFNIQQANFQSLSNVKGAMCMREVQLNNKNVLLQGTYTYLNIYNQDPQTGQWKFSNSISNFIHMAKNVEVDHRENIWVEHMRKGLFRVKLDEKLTKVIDIRHYEQLDRNHPEKCTLFKINGRVSFSDRSKFYTYDDMLDSIIPYKAMNEQLHEIKGVNSVNYMKDDLYWFITDKDAYLVQCLINSFKIKFKVSLGMFKTPPIEGLAKIVYDRLHDLSYICLNNSIARISIDKNNFKQTKNNYPMWISRFTASNENIGETSILPLINGNQLSSGLNNISICLSYPNYGNWSYHIRYKLEGLSDKWMEDLPDMRKEYMNLPAGTYCFKAEAYEGNNILSKVSLEFEILRPWYLSYWAIFCYFILFVTILTFSLYSVYVYTKRKKDKVIEVQRVRHRTQIEMQEKKIIELEKEQLEADLRFKSKELSAVVMTNIAHQEFLTTLKEEIQQQKLSGQYTRKSLDKLLVMLSQNMVSDEESWSLFQANFDRIHENFFRNLKEKYPELTPGDLRLCGLLRLNLPTKEISKLMNISIRGVDAARYRLRKKLNLSPESNLTDFMIKFK